MKIKVSLIISTYNWSEALRLVLKSVAIQTVLPEEILIADDGSDYTTKVVIEEFKNQLNIPVKHIWQKDLGFRKAKILNKAIASAKGDYIITVDGDCILHKEFVGDHLRFSMKKTFLFGSRVNIQEHYLPILFEKSKITFNFWSKGIKKRTRALRCPLWSHLFGIKTSISKKVRGCNISFWKADIIKVNGYDESIEGWGREDSELFIRVLNSGCRSRRLRYRGIVYHIWHNEKSKNRVSINNQVQELTISKCKVWCENGIDQYLGKT